MKNLVEKLVALKGLESNYGWQSCFDVPDAYDDMERLSTEIENDLSEIEGSEVVRKHLREVLETIAFDALNGNIALEEIEVHHYSQDDYIETYILEGMDESARKMFDSLFYFMDSDARNHWIEANYLAGEPNTYCTKWVDHILIIAD